MIQRNKAMKAITYHNYGSPEVLTLSEVKKPKINPDEVLVKVYASSITTADSMMRQGTPKFGRIFLGLNGPKKNVIGTGFAGVIMEIGENVTHFNIGDRVFGETSTDFGAHAEFLKISEDGVLMDMPDFLEFEEAALLCDGPLTSFNFLRNIHFTTSSDRVLINGAAGSLGTAAIQIAKYFGANVTAVCSRKNFDFVRSLGADHCIDYHEIDFTETQNEYDVIFDTVGKSSFTKSKKVLSRNGEYLSPVLGGNMLWSVLKTSFISDKRALFSATGLKNANDLRKDLEEVLQIIEKGKLRPAIDRLWSMEEVAEAHEIIDSGHKRGNFVLQVA